MRNRPEVARLVGLLMMGFSAITLSDQLDAQSAGYALVDVTVLPMDRERVLKHQTIVVRGDRILAVGSKDSVRVPVGYRRLEFDDDITVMPGLVDAHTHLRYDLDLPLYLAGGVTTVRNMNGGPEHLAWRRAVEQGGFGPRIITAGPTLYGREPATRQAAFAMIDSLTRQGYDFIKVYDGLPAQSYQWVVDAAREKNMPIAGHIPTAVGLTGVLRAHQLSIEHAEQLVYHSLGDSWDWTRLGVIADSVNAGGAAVTPTLEIIHSLVASVDDRQALFARPEFAYVHPETQAFWLSSHRTTSAENRLLAEIQDALVRELQHRGVPLLVGTDAYLIGTIGPWAVRREITRLHHAGLSRYEALRAATAAPGAALRLGSGTVVAGTRADLLVVRGNPMADLNALERVEGVIAAGRWYPGVELAGRLAEIRSKYAPGQALVSVAMAGRAGEAIASYQRSVDSAQADAGLLAYLARIARDEGRFDDLLNELRP